MERRLLVATYNRGKMREMAALLAGLPATLVFPADLGLELEVDETGASYLENARLKAHAFANASGLVALADDSGLEVDALGGAPGVRSARYAAGSDADRIAVLLAQLDGVPYPQRSARFRCVVVAAAPGSELLHAEGVCEGMIAFEPAGQGGFGYDPVFYIPQAGCTMAQLPEEEKNRISHRARAVTAARPALRAVL